MTAGDGGASLLELGCGTGRVLLPLARAGHTVTGIDRSPRMIEYCRTKLQAESTDTQRRVTLVEADMTSFDLDERFDMIFCAFNTFHHLRTSSQQVACLERCRAHLARGGHLALDLFNPDPTPDEVVDGAETEPDASAAVTDWTGGRQIRRWLSACVYDRSAQTNECEMTYEIVEADGSTRRLTESFPLRLIHRYELEHLLARSGFQIVSLYGGYDRQPFTEDSLGMIVVAEPVPV